MSDDSRQGTSGMPRLSHAEAENLISARSDSPLPPEQNRLLLAHLASCPSCRAFADSVQTMSRALRDLPVLPASPTVSRQVRERIAQPQSPWARLGGWMFSGRLGAMPAVATALVLVAAVTFALILRGDDGRGPNQQTAIPAASQTEIALKETGTPTATPTEIARQTMTATTEPQVITSTPEQPAFAAIVVSLTPTPEPTETSTATATSEPTETATPEPTETATDEPTETPEPTETATAEPSETPEPTETATREPSATRTPTQEPEPTETPTEEPTETPTAEPTETPTPTETPEPTSTPTEEPSPTRTPRPTRTPEPTETPTPTETTAPTEEPTEEPQTQPTIAGVGGQADETPTDEPTQKTQPDEVDVATAEPTEEDSSGSPPIQCRDENGACGDGDTETPTEEIDETTAVEIESPTPNSEEETPVSEAGALAEAEQLAELGSGVGAPAGPLRMPADLGAMVIVGPDGSMAVVDTSGNLLWGMGAAAYPTWSPRGEVLLYNDLNGEYPAVSVWDRTDGQTYAVGADAGDSGPVADTPAGWIGDQLYYVRSFPNETGRIELHRAAWNGADDELLWSEEGIELGGDWPMATHDGVVIPTTTSWLFIDIAGGESDLGPNAHGISGDPLLSDGGTLMAYPAGNQLIVAPVTSPGVAQAVIPYDGVSGFEFAPGGEQIVVADGTGMQIYSTQDGAVISGVTSDGGVAIIAPYWDESGIRYLEIGETTLLKLILLGAFS